MNVRTNAIARRDAEVDASQQRAIAARAANEARPRSAIEAMAQRLQVTPSTLQTTLRSTVFSACRSNEEFVALVVVANEYRLNPLLKEIYAFPTKGGGIQAMVSIDGWIRIMNEHPEFDAIEFEYINDEHGKTEAIEAVIYRKDKTRPTKVIEYMDECKRNTEPWNKSPRRMLRHRALIQGARVAFGFASIASEGDETEGQFTLVPEVAPSLPSRETLSDHLDDRIPDFDGGDDQQVDPDTGEVQTDSRGMTEIDEETGRQLDAGEPAAGDGNGEQAAAASDVSPAEAFLEKTRSGIAAAKNAKYLTAVETEWLKNAAAYDDEIVAGIDAELAARRKVLADGGKG